MLCLVAIKDMMGRWFGGTSPDFNEMQIANISLVHTLAHKVIDNTLDEEWKRPIGRLALCILFDQFPRSVYRGTAKAFQYDALAVAIVHDVINKELFLGSDYTAIHRFFMCVALQHSEILSDQILGVQLASKITFDANQDLKDYFASLPGYPMEHHDVIVRFGRFPSRNSALGRDSTDDELAWMNSPECPKWAKTQLAPSKEEA